jgi:hypothetical protein
MNDLELKIFLKNNKIRVKMEWIDMIGEGLNTFLFFIMWIDYSFSMVLANAKFKEKHKEDE